MSYDGIHDKSSWASSKQFPVSFACRFLALMRSSQRRRCSRKSRATIGRMRTDPLEQRFDRILEVLLAMYPYGRTWPRFKKTHAEVTHIAHGWYVRFKRDVQSTMLLAEHGFAEEASPLRRSIVEHVVALRWLAACGSEVADVVRRGNANAAGRKQAAFEGAGWTILNPEALTDAIDQMDDPDERDRYLNFKQRAQDFGGAHHWADYLNEISHVHPCWESAFPYIDEVNGTPTPRSEPKPMPSQAIFCTVRLHEALYVLDSMVEGEPQHRRLEDLWFNRIRPLVIERRKAEGLDIPADLLDKGSQSSE